MVGTSLVNDIARWTQTVNLSSTVDTGLDNKITQRSGNGPLVQLRMVETTLDNNLTRWTQSMSFTQHSGH
jgi:hypothetical protein